MILAIVAAFNVSLNTPNSELPFISMANIEALARYELPEVVIECSPYGSGKCYYVEVEEGLFGVCRFHCEYSGKPNHNCNSCWVDFINFCSAVGTSCG
ncbi:MAG: hypothetical protein PHT02_14565 [Tissierellia bacterium]|nr:hypothetical protein [Tissierellia bacterium]